MKNKKIKNFNKRKRFNVKIDYFTYEHQPAVQMEGHDSEDTHYEFFWGLDPKFFILGLLGQF